MEGGDVARSLERLGSQMDKLLLRSQGKAIACMRDKHNITPYPFWVSAEFSFHVTIKSPDAFRTI